MTFRDVRRLARSSRTQHLEAGEFLFQQGDPGDRIYLIRRGQVEIVSEGTLLAVRGRGEVIGEMALLDSGQRSAGARARGAVEVRSLDEPSLHVLLEHEPTLMMRMMKLVTGRMRTMQTGLVEAVVQRRQLVGDYELLGLLGRGGMGAVHRARDLRSEREVAVKVLDFSDLGEDGRARFLQECRLLSQLDHPNIVRFLDSGQSEETLYMVMELIAGEPLSRRMSPQGMPVGEALAILEGICRALQYAHDREVLHRDLKPGNVMVDRQGTVKLVDFGLSRVQDSLRLTRTSGLMGTPQYMPPERLLDHGMSEGPGGDQYALGILTFAMLAGHVPFDAADSHSILAQHLRHAPPDLLALRPELSPAMVDCVYRMLRKNPQERFASVEEAWGALSASGVSRATEETTEDFGT